MLSTCEVVPPASRKEDTFCDSKELSLAEEAKAEIDKLHKSIVRQLTQPKLILSPVSIVIIHLKQFHSFMYCLWL